MSKQEDFCRPEKPLEKTREIDNEARISKKAEMRRKFNRNQKRITLWDIQLSSLTSLSWRRISLNGFFSGISQKCFANTEISMSVLASLYNDAGGEKKKEEEEAESGHCWKSIIFEPLIKRHGRNRHRHFYSNSNQLHYNCSTK